MILLTRNLASCKSKTPAHTWTAGAGCPAQCPVRLWVARDSNSSNSRGNLFHCLIILSVKSCFLVFRWNPKLTCVHLVLSLKATEKSLAPPSSFPPARCQDLPQVFSSPHLQVPALSASHTWCWARESSTPDGSSSVLSNKEGSLSLTC